MRLTGDYLLPDLDGLARGITAACLFLNHDEVGEEVWIGLSPLFLVRFGEAVGLDTLGLQRGDGLFAGGDDLVAIPLGGLE